VSFKEEEASGTAQTLILQDPKEVFVEKLLHQQLLRYLDKIPEPNPVCLPHATLRNE
jgi:hypothetical protein